MATIQIKNVPEATHAELRRRAAAEGKSLQEYMLALLDQHASRRTVAEVMAEIDKTATATIDIHETRRMIEAERAGR